MRHVLSMETMVEAIAALPADPDAVIKKPTTMLLGHAAMCWMLAKLERQTAYIPVTGCWVWEGGLSGNGYGRVRFANRMWTTHRVGWALLRPETELRPNQLLDHVKERCTCRACWNPEHLEPVDAKTNFERGASIPFPEARA